MNTDDFSGIPESGLLDMVRMIISLPGPITGEHRRTLAAINQELAKRDKQAALASRREKYAIRRLRQKIKETIR